MVLIILSRTETEGCMWMDDTIYFLSHHSHRPAPSLRPPSYMPRSGVRLRAVCEAVELEVDAELGCVLGVVELGSGGEKRDTAALPVNPTEACSQFAAWGAQLGSPSSSRSLERDQTDGRGLGGRTGR